MALTRNTMDDRWSIEHSMVLVCMVAFPQVLAMCELDCMYCLSSSNAEMYFICSVGLIVVVVVDVVSEQLFKVGTILLINLLTRHIVC